VTQCPDNKEHASRKRVNSPLGDSGSHVNPLTRLFKYRHWRLRGTQKPKGFQRLTVDAACRLLHPPCGA
jgi:hypothetical protein